MTLDRTALAWVPGCVVDALRRGGVAPAGTHILLAVADHYEPSHGSADFSVGLRRVRRWVDEYPRALGEFRDADGCPPRHSFFFPQEEYVPEYLDLLRQLCAGGFGEVEVHLHHDRDTSAALAEKLAGFVRTLRSRHGLLCRDETNAVRYAFIHGNYALDNSRPDGRWCGVDEELTVLNQTGCYADFTMPSAPNPTQTSTINRIYFARDDERPKSHDKGIQAAAGTAPPADSLLMIQGALTLNWHRRKWGLLPRLENSELLHNNPPTAARVALCASARVCVAGRPEWVFVKLHTHGAVDRNAEVLLGEPGRRFHSELAGLVKERGWTLHYVTAREMANIAFAAIDGRSGNPGEYRDYRFRLFD